MDPEYVRDVQRVFVDLYKKGLIYRGKRMVNWCPATQTALSDEEVEMKPQKGFMYHFKVEVAEAPGTWLTIATTRPETIPGDTAVAVNPKDTRYAHLIGKHIIRPLPIQLPREEKLIPIIGDEQVDFEFGTGVLKVTPAHDKADFEIGQRHKLPIVDIMNPDGTMNDLAGESLTGLDRFEAREVAAERLKELGAMVDEKPYENNVGFSQRADVPIEPRLSEQWFLKYPSVEQSRKCVEQDDERTATIVHATGKEFDGNSIRELRKAASDYARQNGFLSRTFRNEDSGIEIRVGRQSLTHAYSNLGVANIQAVAVLPELIQKALWIGSEPHDPPNPIFKNVHRFIAALAIAGNLHRVLTTAKEFWDGTILYDHKVIKITPGGKSLEAHLPKEKLDTQPAPSAKIKIELLLADVKLPQKIHFHPQRWAKVYDHWLANIQDWCISRQLWWGHRVPVWTLPWKGPIATESSDSQIVRLELPFLTKDQNRQIAVQVLRPGGDNGVIFFGVAVQPGHPEIEQLLEKNSAKQDPDVLDTWFSSWLWPFATMGWTGDKSQDANNPTLQKFYPTTDLVTGPDIIFFWVARMIMAGYEYMGDLPFRNVYFTGIIRDKQGRKMSKTLGNSPDPLELIARYGADALRFGTMRSAPLGQDVLFDEKDVELGRNFCNKLWNACRFRQMVGSAGFPIQGEIDPKLLTSDDKWILLKLNTAIRELTDSFAEYKFSEAAATIYRFFWSEYCDWHVEATKAVFQSEDAPRKANTLAVIDFVLSHTLRLFHPFLPFITEELWHGMGYHEDMPPEQGGKSIMFAPWPKPFDADFLDFYGLDNSQFEFTNKKYELVTQGRNLRREGNIQSGKKVKFVLKPAREILPLDVAVIKILLNAEALDVDPNYAPKKGTLAVHSELGDLFLPLEGLVDLAAEKARLTKELEKVEAEILKVEQKLANPNFTQNAPPEVLREHEKRLADWQAKKLHLQNALKALEG
jgi:valyl-tRNA synthetase